MNEEIDRLIHRYFERELPSEEEAALWERVRADEAAADRFVEMAEMESGLIEKGRGVQKALESMRAARGKPAGSMRWAVIGAAAAGLAAAVWTFWPAERRPATQPGQEAIARVAAAGPGVTVYRGTETFAGREEMPLLAGDRITTSAVSAATIEYRGEATRINIDAGTDLTLSRWGPGRRIEMKSGRISAEVAAQPAGRPFIVTTPQGDAEMEGTNFSLAARPASTWLKVTRDRARLRRTSDGASATVEAGEYAMAAVGVEMKAGPAGKAMTAEMADVNRMTDWLLGRKAAPEAGSAELARADVNGDGRLDLADLNLYVDRLVGRIGKFPIEP
jgi:hypothetical protein